MGYAATAILSTIKACGDLFPRLSVVVSFGRQFSVCSPVVPFSGVVFFLSLVSSLKAFAVSFFSYIVDLDGAEFVPGNRTIPRAAVSHLAAV